MLSCFLKDWTRVRPMMLPPMPSWPALSESNESNSLQPHPSSSFILLSRSRSFARLSKTAMATMMRDERCDDD